MELNQEQIKQIIPHRDPFLFLNKVTNLEPGRKASGQWQLKPDFEVFKGHFPDYPVLPGVLAVESMAQLGAVVMLSVPENQGKTAFFAGIDSVRFKKELKPGDTLQLEGEVTKIKGPIGKAKASVSVDGQLAVEAELMFAIKKV